MLILQIQGSIIDLGFKVKSSQNWSKKKNVCRRCFNYKNKQWFLANFKGDNENEHDNENYYLNVRKWKNKELFFSSIGNFVC
jgi:hypothetical protein